VTNAITIWTAPKPPFDAATVEYKKLVFSGGEVQVRLSTDNHINNITTLIAKVRNSEELMELLLVTDAIRQRNQHTRISLRLGYLPYARQDRVCEPGEALSLKVFCSLINSQNYESVQIWDCHSDVGLFAIDRVEHVTQAQIVAKILDHFHDGRRYTLVAPDTGAMKKIRDVSKRLNMPYIQADKTRNTDTGAITGTVVNAEVCGDVHYLIVDDICDGGATFVGLADELKRRGANLVSLFVTHGIFSKGLGVLSPKFERIYCANSWLPSQGNLSVLIEN
jgi:ribose-phosphate pyrophosphokinase